MRMSSSASGYFALNSRYWRRPGESRLPGDFEILDLRFLVVPVSGAFTPRLALAWGPVVELLFADILARF